MVEYKEKSTLSSMQWYKNIFYGNNDNYKTTDDQITFTKEMFKKLVNHKTNNKVKYKPTHKTK